MLNQVLADSAFHILLQTILKFLCQNVLLWRLEIIYATLFWNLLLPYAQENQ